MLAIAVLGCQPSLGQVVAEEGDCVLGRLLEPGQPHARVQGSYALPLRNHDQGRQSPCATMGTVSTAAARPCGHSLLGYHHLLPLRGAQVYGTCLCMPKAD